LTKSPNGIVQAPVLWGLAGRSADLHSNADDAREDQDHADEDDEVGRVLADRKSGERVLVPVGDDIVFHEIEQQPEGHDGHPETRETGKRWLPTGARWERRDG
jgi:hypothetical protein